MNTLMFVAVAAGILAVLYALVLSHRVSKASDGTDRMKEIASAIAEGAHAFLFSEYKFMAIFIVVLFIILWILRRLPTSIGFIRGALLSILAGYAGMTVATRANVRTADAARTGGMSKALSVAFSGGAVMGMCVAGFGIFGVSIIYAITGNADILSDSPWVLLP